MRALAVVLTMAAVSTLAACGYNPYPQRVIVRQPYAQRVVVHQPDKVVVHKRRVVERPDKVVVHKRTVIHEPY